MNYQPKDITMQNTLLLLNPYQDFTDTTAKYPKENERAYLALGIVDEVAELHEKVASFIDGTSTAYQIVNGVVAESGDVLWYVARDLRRMGLRFGDLYDHAMPAFDMQANLQNVMNRLISRAGFLAGRAKKSIRDGKDYRDETIAALFEILLLLNAIARFWGCNLVLVSVENQSKLASRLARNTLQGDGDNR